jgi:hypothetical protein
VESLVTAALLAGVTGVVAWGAGVALARRHRAAALAVATAALAVGAAWVARSTPPWWLAVLLQGLAVAVLVMAVTPPRLPARPAGEPDEGPADVGAPGPGPGAPGGATTP